MIHLELGPFRLFAVWNRVYYEPKNDLLLSRGVRVAWISRGTPIWKWARGLRTWPFAGYVRAD